MKERSVVQQEPALYLAAVPRSAGAGSPKGLVRQHLAAAGERSLQGGVSALVAVVRQGLHFSELESLRDQLELPMDRLAGYLGLARATVHRRKLSGQLTPDESDKVLRFARLLGQATRLFGSVEEAQGWLNTPQHGLGGAVPLEYAGTEVGSREVESLLGRIDYGVYS
ncbi:MAG TPA: antitoxin Xre/MbcA/ParS toxin-binding domain-containing protein [Chthoniobacteraceae bacterium]